MRLSQASVIENVHCFICRIMIMVFSIDHERFSNLIGKSSAFCNAEDFYLQFESPAFVESTTSAESCLTVSPRPIKWHAEVDSKSAHLTVPALILQLLFFKRAHPLTLAGWCDGFRNWRIAFYGSWVKCWLWIVTGSDFPPYWLAGRWQHQNKYTRIESHHRANNAALDYILR